MKTLFQYVNSDQIFEPQFFELDGDYSYLDGIAINLNENKELEDELYNILYGSDNCEQEKIKVKILDKPTKDWDKFVLVGFA